MKKKNSSQAFKLKRKDGKVRKDACAVSYMKTAKERVAFQCTYCGKLVTTRNPIKGRTRPKDKTTKSIICFFCSSKCLNSWSSLVPTPSVIPEPKPSYRISVGKLETPISRLIASLEGEAKMIVRDWIQSDTTLEEDYEMTLASHFMCAAAIHLRKARILGKL